MLFFDTYTQNILPKSLNFDLYILRNENLKKKKEQVKI